MGFSPKTVDTYYGIITRADTWMTARGHPAAKAPASLVARYADTLPRSWSTRKGLRAALAAYWELVHRRNPPLAVIRVPPKPEMVCRALDEDEAAALARAARDRGDMRAFPMTLGLYQAMRREEMARCRWVDFKGGRMLTVIGKGEKQRTLDVSPSVLGHPYFRAHRPPTPGAGDYLFPGRFGGHVNPATIWKWVTELAEDVGVFGVTPHRLRHTCLATQNDTTGDLRAVRDFAGHSRTATTEGYTRTKASAMHAVMLSVDYLNERPRRGRRPHAPPPSLFDDDEGR